MATTTIPGARCITDDTSHYCRSVGAYDSKVVTYTFNKVWLPRTFPDTIVARLRQNCPDVKELRLLSVGSGNGDIDCTMLKHLRAKFETISNHVVEPGADMISEYKTRINDMSSSNELTNVTCRWYQQGIDEFMASSGSSTEKGTPPKFHLISAMHSLYYAKSQEEAVDFLYDRLEKGGLLVIMMQDENCGYLKIHRRFPLYDGVKTLLAALANICKRLHEKGIQYDQQLLPATYDITSCYQGTREGSYIVDFLSHVMHFEKVAPEQLKKDFLDYVRSEECSTVVEDKVLLNADETALIAERKQ